MKLPTASSLERALSCPASFCLPQIRERGGKAANRGTEIHKFVENCHKMPYGEALGLVPAEFQDICGRIDIKQLIPADTQINSEVAYAWDYITGEARCLGVGGGRDYSGAKATEIVGTLDQELLWPDITLARDLKTGYGYLAPANRNPQLRFFALCHSRVYGRQQVVELVKILDTGELACEPAELSRDDIDQTAASLRVMVQSIFDAKEIVNQGKQPDVSEGQWCRYCPAFEACPGKVGLLQKYLGAASFDFSALAQSYQLIRNLEALAKKGLEKVKELVEDSGEPLDIGQGMVFGRSPKDFKFREFRKA